MISVGQVTAHGGSASSLCIVPPGPCQVILGCDPASTSTAYIGITSATGGTLSSANGFPLAASTSVTLYGYTGAHGAALSVTASGTLSATVGWMVSRG